MIDNQEDRAIASHRSGAPSGAEPQGSRAKPPAAIADDDDSEFETLMETISTVYSLRVGHMLTKDDFDAIQRFDQHFRTEENNAVEAFHQGYQQGLLEGGSADIVAMNERLEAKSLDLSVAKAMRMVGDQRIEKLEFALKNLLDLPGIGNLPGFMTGTHIATARAMIAKAEGQS